MGFFRTLLNIVFPDSESEAPPTEEDRKKKFEEDYNDHGKFTYEDDGFIYQFEKGPKKITWASIVKLVAYKADLMTIDEIRMEVSYGDLYFIITEETPGFYQFVIKTKEIFPSIPKDWDITIIQPAFATNYTVLYEK